PATQPGFIPPPPSRPATQPGFIPPPPSRPATQPSVVVQPDLLPSNAVMPPDIPTTMPTVMPLPSAGESDSLSGLLVLLCEPDPILSAAMVARLKAEELRVVVVTDGTQARQAVERERPSAIVSEVALPKVDGFNLLLGVRARDATREIPFFLMSSRMDTQQSAKALELGADDFVHKPLNMDFLVGKLKRAIQRFESAERARREVEESRRQPAVPATVASVGTEHTGVVGSLQQMGVPEIVQSLELGRKTAVVTLSFATGESGTVTFVEGEVVHAVLGQLTGVDAFYEMAPRNQGSFRIRYGAHGDGTRSITVSTTFLLLEAMRRIDEAGGAS
ncbi:MAG: DUF4388 domain-containing protein, partial [Myxococcota bacterium]